MNEVQEDNINDATGEETEEYLRGVKSSTCLLLPATTPSPLDFKHPLSEELSEAPFISLNEDNQINSVDGCGGDSSSSGDSNSVVHDPISAQLINNISMLDYQSLGKNGDVAMVQPEILKLNGTTGNAATKKLPSFVNWNWPLIRKILVLGFCSCIIGCLAAIIEIILTMPDPCNPVIPWHQGKVFYEVFPASFKDSNNDGVGDLKGIVKKLDYIESLHGSAIRLNYIFEAYNYPDQYYNTTSLMNIDRSIGVLKDFQELVDQAHKREIKIILDIPVLSMANFQSFHESNHSYEFTRDQTENSLDSTSNALAYWAQVQNVDGFYLKNLEKYVDDGAFGKSLQFWKKIIGDGKILIANEATLKNVYGTNLQILLNRIDLIDIHLDLQYGIDRLKTHIDDTVSGILWAKAHHPWVLWNIGNVNSERISTRHENNTLALTALEFILPGTVSIFYGDEIGLGGLSAQEVEGDFHEHEHIHNLVPMIFPEKDKQENSAILPWNSKSALEPRFQYIDVVKSLIDLRLNTPAIYLRGLYKNDRFLNNIKIRKVEGNLLIIERRYPRRNTCVFVGNLGRTPIATDLSMMFYKGTVAAATDISIVKDVLYFDKIVFQPNSALIMELKK